MSEKVEAATGAKNEAAEKTIRIDELMNSWAIYCHSQEQWKNAKEKAKKESAQKAALDF